MNYKKHYNKLIDRAKNRILEGYCETHHIVPRCMNGSNDKSNLVDLTAREHFIAHILLVKMFPKEKGLIFAVQMMCVSSKNQNRINNRMYEWLKKRFSKSQSENQTGEKNSQYGNIWIYNLNEKISKPIKKEELQDYLDLDWKRGRVTDFTDKICKFCGKAFSREISSKYCSSVCKQQNYKKNYKQKMENGEITKHTQSTKDKMKGHTRNNGKKNPMFGTVYVYSLEKQISKRIKKEELQNYLDLGWLKGRKQELEGHLVQN